MVDLGGRLVGTCHRTDLDDCGLSTSFRDLELG
jgi:hypothetical protein